MRKKLALVLLMEVGEEGPSWPAPLTVETLPLWYGMPMGLPWTLAWDFTNAWTRLLLELMSWPALPLDLERDDTGR
ncbi:hypothetical protein [Azohydromonas caseinilytica]|uniref:Uncharacterized protein n=1 Tax=Azohydromonas caseinilytica TaxID=2728836 RepID=A0A848FAQ4_9BURK|nr:hypothetical protein [Azohydromonas caseinilytica]NML16368.1 hypothetical protein [Azohydromonas caseinilytica]